MPSVYLNGYTTCANISNKALQVSSLIDDQKERLNIPFFDIDRIIVIGNASVTTPVFYYISQNSIPMHYITNHGKWLGAFYPNQNGHALRRLKQYQLANNQQIALTISKAITITKIKNSRRVLQRLAASRKQTLYPDQVHATEQLKSLINKAQQADTIATLRGYEGVAAACYFKRLSAYFPKNIPFKGRNRRPPQDAANALLSWTYTILLSEIDASVRTAGLDPCLGFYHQISHGTPSLSLDLLEIFRAPLCDMLSLRLLNHNILNQDDFQFNAEDGGVYLTKEARKKYFPEYERTMQRRFSETKNSDHTDFRGLIRKQVNIILKTMENQQQPTFFQMQ